MTSEEKITVSESKSAPKIGKTRELRRRKKQDRRPLEVGAARDATLPAHMWLRIRGPAAAPRSLTSWLMAVTRWADVDRVRFDICARRGVWWGRAGRGAVTADGKMARLRGTVGAGLGDARDTFRSPHNFQCSAPARLGGGGPRLFGEGIRLRRIRLRV